MDAVVRVCETHELSASLVEVPIAESIYKTPEGEAEIRAVYDEAFAGLGSGYQSLTIRTRRYPVRSTPRSVEWVPHACSNSNRFCRV